jgi:hypothetical protein
MSREVAISESKTLAVATRGGILAPRPTEGARPVAIDGEKLAAVVAALDGGATRAAVRRTFGICRPRGRMSSRFVWSGYATKRAIRWPIPTPTSATARRR